MRPTNYSHEQQAPSQREVMYERWRSFTTAAAGVYNAVMGEHPDLFQPAQSAAELRAQPPQPAAETRPVTATPAAEQPHVATAGNLIALTEQEQELAAQQELLASSRRDAYRESR